MIVAPIDEDPDAVRGLYANPAIVAADSWRPSRSRRVARMASGLRMIVTLPESWLFCSGQHVINFVDNEQVLDSGSTPPPDPKQNG